MNGILNGVNIGLTNGSVYAIPGIDEFIDIQIQDTQKVGEKPDPIKIANRIIYDVFSLNQSTLEERTRKREIVFPRQIHMTLTQLQGASLEQSGKACNRDHATALHASKTIRDIITTKYPHEDYVKIMRCLEKLKNVCSDINMSRLQRMGKTTNQ